MANGELDEYPSFCSICGDTIDSTPHTMYVNCVCDACNRRAVSEPGVPAQRGDNPVFIDGIRCFRRKAIIQRDALCCDDIEEFVRTHYQKSGPIHTFNRPDPPQSDKQIRQLPEVEELSENIITTRVIENNILNESADTLICGITTNPSLSGGVAGAVCDASEYSLRSFIRPMAPFELGDVVVTDGFDLPYSYIVFVAASPAKVGKKATKESVQNSVKNALDQIAVLRLPSVVLPLIGTGAGGLDTKNALSGILDGIRSSQLSAPISVRIVVRNESDRRAVENSLPDTGSDIIRQEFTDPLDGKLSAHIERVHKPEPDSWSDWELYQWITFDPFSGEITEFDDRDSVQSSHDYGPPEQIVEVIEDAKSKFGAGQYLPEQWFAQFKSFNSYMGGYRAAMDHPRLDRYLYNREQSLVGILRGLEHRDSAYNDILELALHTDGNENIARIRYQLPKEKIDKTEDIIDSCLQTSLRIIEYTVETMSQIDFDAPMSSITEVTEIHRIEVIAHAYCKIVFELEIPLDLAEDIVYGNLSKNALQTIAMRCENFIK